MIRLNDHVIWVQPNKVLPYLVNMNKMDYGRWNECDGMWTEWNKDETWSMKCGLKEMTQNMNHEINNVTDIISNTLRR